jgi:hypothetical protein
MDVLCIWLVMCYTNTIYVLLLTGVTTCAHHVQMARSVQEDLQLKIELTEFSPG